MKQVNKLFPVDFSFEHYPVYVSSILCEENIIKFNQKTSISFNKIDFKYNLNQNCLRCNISKDIFYFNDHNNNNNKDINMDTPLLFILSSILGKEFKLISTKIGFKQTKPKKDPSVLNILLQLKKANKKYFKNLVFIFQQKIRIFKIGNFY